MSVIEALGGADHRGLWAGAIVVYALMYLITDPLLELRPQYRRLKPAFKLYVQSNLIKAFMLGVWAVALWEVVWEVALLGKWHMSTLRALAPIYAGLDLVSLVVLRDRMSTSTLWHHVFVVLFAGLISASNELRDTWGVRHVAVAEGTILGALCVYGLFSMLAYFVNGFLALRFLATPSEVNARFTDAVARVCAAGYAGICLFHWAFQLRIAATHPYPGYVLVFYPFVRDDLILMHRLATYAAPASAITATGATRTSDDATPSPAAAPAAAPAQG